MSHHTVHFSNDGRPVSNLQATNQSDNKSQKSILSQKGLSTLQKNGHANTIDVNGTNYKNTGGQFEGLPDKASSKGNKAGDTNTFDDRHPLSVTGGQNSNRYEDDDDKYYKEMARLHAKVIYKPPVGSLYQRDFVKHPIDPKPPKVDNNPWSTFRIEQPIDFNTTSRNAYVDWKQDAPPRHHMDLWKASEKNIPFGGRSSYKVEFLNWGQNPSAMEKPVAPKTVISELPFVGHSMYKTDFSEPRNVTQVYKVDHDLFGKKSPLSPDIPFIGEPHTAQNYKPFKVIPQKNVVHKEQYEKVNPYPGQFRTTYGEDFQNKDNKLKTKSFKPRFSNV